ncbi:hypothetical protein [Flavobacterium sp. ABG]|uniref:hypothetical protein n=1 Tax=Flavobacterium sp. ABG TaxID=1423322 RepID=UPI00103D13A7|nr:hypothetical protein [Flavobacterium sp. ABG]
MIHRIEQLNLIRSSLSDPNGVPEITNSSVTKIKKEVRGLFTSDMIANETRSQVQVGGANGAKNGEFEEKFHPNSNLLELQMLYFVKLDAVRCLDMEFN